MLGFRNGTAKHKKGTAMHKKGTAKHKKRHLALFSIKKKSEKVNDQQPVNGSVNGQRPALTGRWTVTCLTGVCLYFLYFNVTSTHYLENIYRPPHFITNILPFLHFYFKRWSLVHWCIYTSGPNWLIQTQAQTQIDLDPDSDSNQIRNPDKLKNKK